jgi:hypothetical protein
MLKWILVGHMVTTLVVAMAPPAGAQRCLHVESDPLEATLTVRGGAGETRVAPADFCSLQPGLTYRLTVSRGGYERRTLKFSFRDYEQQCKFSGIWRSEVPRSMILPGWGQKRLGESGRMVETILFLVVDGLKVYQVWKHYDHLRDQYDIVTGLAEHATTQDQLETLGRTSQKLAMDANAYREATILTAALGGWVYVRNVLETYLLAAPPKAISTDGSDFKVVTPRRSRKRAALRSFFFPGLGQRYQGNTGRAFVFRSGVFVLALYVIDRKLRYDLAKVEYDMAVAEFENAKTVEEKKSLVQNIARLGAEVDKREDSFHAFVIATGCLWAANVLEAIAAGSQEEKSDRFELTTSYSNSTVWSGIRINF